VTTGGATLGNCAIGSVGIETIPASRMINEQTAAKIGRRRKNSITQEILRKETGHRDDVP
jgi:hypothetical protein